MPNSKKGREAWLVNSFTDRAYAGNPAGVVPDAAGLSEADMQKIAAELNDISETAFILPAESDAADFRLRYFTSTMEVDLCGHATVAALFTLGWNGGITGESGTRTVRAQTPVGILELGLEFSEGQPLYAVMEQLVPKMAAAPGAEQAATILGLSAEQLASAPEIGCCSTGIWVCYVPVADLEALAAVNIQPELIQLLWPENEELAGVYAFAFRNDKTTQGRFFSLPQYGIFEDPVTGTASGGLGAFLIDSGLLAADDELIAHQGVEMGRPGQVSVRRGTDGCMVIRGQAVPVFRGHLLN
jgi:trans-2,3-dihydro-3-hydroxyanthranilate isomerase